ncbi:MAG: hemolysin III family protein [Oscillospiraceae bacterium]|nr:hemolysin III family protein [Oscillospiraceae bacterium]
MAKRIKLSQRILPDYSRGEERMNMVTHIVGGGLAIVAAVLCILRAALRDNTWGIVACVLYSFTHIGVYTMSSIYHGLHDSMAKRVMQVIDHCAIYFLIAGTYTAVLLGSLRTVYPTLAWSLFFFEWVLGIIAATLTAIDLKKYDIFSMTCYIAMGWAILPFWRQVAVSLTGPGFALLLSGGIAYTIGAVLYGIGAKKRWMHSVFHIFVVLGSMLQFFAILLYGL